MGNGASDLVRGVPRKIASACCQTLADLLQTFIEKPHETNDTMQEIQERNEYHEQERQRREAEDKERWQEREASARQREQATLDAAQRTYEDAIQAREEASKLFEEAARQREEATLMAAKQIEVAARMREEAASAAAKEREEAALLTVQQIEAARQTYEDAIQAREEASKSVAKQFEESARQREEAALMAAKQIEVAARMREEAACAAAKEREEAALQAVQQIEAAARTREEAALAEAAKAKEALHKGIRPVVMPTPEQVTSAKKRMQLHPEKLHFAVCGSSGSGKSTVINAVRGLGCKGEGAARVGVTECTSEISRYPDPRKELPYSRFIWFDIPGAGTTAVPDWQYFNDQGLFVFDFIIMVYDVRFTTIDVGIIENCLRFNIPVFIVRSKADQHIQNMIKVEKDCEPGDAEYHQVYQEVYQEMADSYVSATRTDFYNHMEYMADNKDIDMWDQQLIHNLRVYIVSGATLRGLMMTPSVKRGKVIDETQLIEDMLRAAARRRYSNTPDETKKNLFKKGKEALSAGVSAGLSSLLNARTDKSKKNSDPKLAEEMIDPEANGNEEPNFSGNELKTVLPTQGAHMPFHVGKRAEIPGVSLCSEGNTGNFSDIGKSEIPGVSLCSEEDTGNFSNTEKSETHSETTTDTEKKITGKLDFD